ncbi:PTS sugar transporter subunit IIA [Carnobacterium sp. FSL W8-0810]|uniref:PTS sugar transporter subunit IIA n=1 Tax=Carnobacterium sp. FSL W8-0810 TaxID=2954705 RepID=UPI0030F9410B
MCITDMLYEDLIDLSVTATTEDELFNIIGDRLLQKGYVNEGYLTGIKEREEKYPTGLITQYLNIALPHSDSEFIETPFIYIVRLTNPVLVKQMGDSQEMKVHDLFFLGIKDSTKQVNLLSQLMEMFMDKRFVTDYISYKNEFEVFELISDYIKKGAVNYG